MNVCKINGKKQAETDELNFAQGGANWSKEALVPVETWERNVPNGVAASSNMPTKSSHVVFTVVKNIHWGFLANNTDRWHILRP